MYKKITRDLRFSMSRKSWFCGIVLGSFLMGCTPTPPPPPPDAPAIPPGRAASGEGPAGDSAAGAAKASGRTPGVPGK